MRKIMMSVIAMFLAAGPAGSQALKNHNSNAPVDVDADRIEVQDRADRAVFSGNVVVRQQGLTLNAARLTVAYERSGKSNVDIERLDATGGVVVKSDSETARGDIAIYDLPRRLITMIGNVTLIQRTNTVRGGRLVIDLSTGRAIVDGKGASGGEGTSSGGRVSGRFTVSQRNAGDAQPQ
jgi:lipopolysaccharide export system protein LptA